MTPAGRDFTSPLVNNDPGGDSSLSEDDYRAELRILQSRLAAAVDRLGSRAWAFVFEGRDTAGKTGTIKRILEAKKMDEDRVSYVHHHAPAFAGEKKAQRDMGYWKSLMPKPGRVVFFDRSWYSTVLGLRVDSPGAMDWNRQFAAINAFETSCAVSGVFITKFMFDISRAEQWKRISRRRFGPKEERKKYSPNDLRAFWQFAGYSKAMKECVERTGTPMAPWYVCDFGDKWRARLKVMETAACLMEGAAPWPIQSDVVRVPGLVTA